MTDNRATELRAKETFVEYDIVVDGVVVGTAETCVERKEITRLEVFEPYRRKGYGSDAVRQLVSKGYRSLWVRSDNDPAIKMYSKCDFKKQGETMFEMRIEGRSDD